MRPWATADPERVKFDGANLAAQGQVTNPESLRDLLNREELGRS
jgi:hypothetical protein